MLDYLVIDLNKLGSSITTTIEQVLKCQVLQTHVVVQEKKIVILFLSPATGFHIDN